MKKTLFICMAAAMMLCSCGALKSNSSSTSAATTQTTSPGTAGQGAGEALKALYTQYKADGKFDYQNMNNIMNAWSLIQNCQGLKNNAKDSNYWKSFATGLIGGSEQLVTEKTSDAVMNGLNTVMENIDTSKMQNMSEKASAVANTASQLGSLLQMFK